MPKKKVVCISDTQCGSMFGLTPPKYMVGGKVGDIQKEMWDKYADIAARVGVADVILANGDLIDGRGDISGSTEQITTDRHVQLDMAQEALGLFCGESTEIVGAIGTEYHGGKFEDFERELLENRMGGIVEDAPFVNISGVLFGMKHHLPTSSSIYTNSAALVREMVMNTLSAAIDEQPWCDVILRSHTHKYMFIGQEAPTAISSDEIISLLSRVSVLNRKKLIEYVVERTSSSRQILAISTPALQCNRTKYGKRKKSGPINWGLIEFNVEDGDFSWKAHLARLKANKSEVIVVQ